MNTKTANRTKESLAVFLVAVILGATLVSCAEPSPLVGTWADNKGDQIVLMADSSFSATITDSTGSTSRSEGTYIVLLNAISFTTSSGQQTVSEWDIRGNMMYLTWTDTTGNSLSLTLYKVKN